MNPITITLPYPISANRYWRQVIINGRAISVPTKESKAYKQHVQALAMVAGIRKPITGRVAIDIKLYPHRPLDWQKRMKVNGSSWDDTVQCIDLDNANKVLLDSLKGVAIEDDKWVRCLHSERMEPDGGEARVVVTIAPVAVEAPQVALFAEAANA
jgi:crossover junction endodeoxyribonuclease RusA